MTVTDIDQNTKSAIGNVTSPNNIALNVPSSAQICSNAPDGVAKCIASGGTSPYSYLWSNGSTLQETNQLVAGTYTVTMTDSKGCTKQKSSQVEDDTDKGLLNSLSATPTSCFYNIGKADISIWSGTPPYQYLWSSSDTTPIIENLAAGAYTVSVTDVHGCSTTAIALVIDQGLPLTSMSTYTICGYNVGTAEVLVGSNTPPYQYIWSSGATTQNIDSLAVGNYYVTVSDVNGCVGYADFYIDIAIIPVSVLTLIPTPFCLSTIAQFVMNPPPPIYPQILWTLSNPLDQIISGQGTDTIKVQWATTGPKLVNYKYGTNGIYCSSFTYSLNVVVCADAIEPDLAGTNVSPNPFSDFLQIEFLEDKPEDARMVLTDISGKTVLAAPLQDLVNELPANNLPPGMYFLKLKSRKGERVWKLVKN